MIVSIILSVDQSVSLSVSQSVCQAVCQSVSLSVSLSVGQSVSLSVGQSVCQSVGQSVYQYAITHSSHPIHCIIIFTGNGSASSSVKKKRKKKRPSSEQSVSSEQAAGSECHTNAAADIDRADDVETNVDDFSDMSPSARHRHRLRHSAFEAADDEPVREPPNSMVSEISEPSKPKKRKKKRKNMAIADAETNTTQVLEFDSERKVAPPARLEPLHPDILSQISTPPLRRKFLPDRDDMTPLPPAGASPQKTRRTKPRDQPSDCGKYSRTLPDKGRRCALA